MRNPPLIARALVAAALAAPLAGQMQWTGRSPLLSPRPLAPGGMVYDAARQQVVLFGGAWALGHLAETWLWDGTQWRLAQPTSAPAARTTAMAYDRGRARVVLFGGFDGSRLLGDTWEWDGDDWTRRVGIGPAPSPRRLHEMVYDEARGRVVLFGGVDTAPRNDTWEWDGARWTAVLAGSPPTPAVPGGQAMAYDALRQRIVLLGGADPSDTWEWDGGGWRRRAPAQSPPARLRARMAYDRARQRVVLFGGEFQGQPRNDTWEWDGTGWAQRHSGPTPPARCGVGLTYDERHARVVLFGGRKGPAPAGFCGDLFEYATTAPAGFQTFGRGCAPFPTLGADNLPWIGASLDLTVGGTAPGMPGALFLGVSSSVWAGTPLPLALDGLGMVGCALRVSIQGQIGFGTTGPTTVLSLPLPGDPGLAGTTTYEQAVVRDPAAAGGWAWTNASVSRMGLR